MTSLTPLIIVNYRNPEKTLRCLDSVKACSLTDKLAPIVIDSGSDTTWAEKLQKFGDWVTYLPQSENLGFSGANNVGIEYALQNFAPETMISTLQQHPKAAAVTPKIYFSKGHEFHSGYQKEEQGKVFWYGGGVIDWKEVVAFHRGVDEVDRRQYDELNATEFATGCCVTLRVQALKKVGLFDHRYFLYLEDLDLSLRFLRNGWNLFYEPRAIVWHDNAGSSGSGSSLHEYYFTRNKFLFGFRYAPLRTKLFLLKQLVIQWQQGTKTSRMAVQDFLLGNYGKRDTFHQ
jgi:GT2 family glycosyltransferase